MKKISKITAIFVVPSIFILLLACRSPEKAVQENRLSSVKEKESPRVPAAAPKDEGITLEAAGEVPKQGPEEAPLDITRLLSLSEESEIPVRRTKLDEILKTAKIVTDYSKYISDDGLVAGDSLANLVGAVKFKEGVEIHKHWERGDTFYSARIRDKEFTLGGWDGSLENLFAVIEPITTERQLKDLWNFVHREDELIESKEKFDQLEKIFFPSALYQMSSKPVHFGLSIFRREEQKDWLVYGITFNDNNEISSVSWRITDDWGVGRKSRSVLRGPAPIYGCVGNGDDDDDCDRQARAAGEFHRAILKCLHEDICPEPDFSQNEKEIPVEKKTIKLKYRSDEKLLADQMRDCLPLEGDELKSRLGTLKLKKGLALCKLSDTREHKSYYIDVFWACREAECMGARRDHALLALVEPITTAKQVEDFWRFYNPDAIIIPQKEIYEKLKRQYNRIGIREVYGQTPKEFGLTISRDETKEEWKLYALVLDRQGVVSMSFRMTDKDEFGERWQTYLPTVSPYHCPDGFDKDAFRQFFIEFNEALETCARGGPCDATVDPPPTPAAGASAGNK